MNNKLLFLCGILIFCQGCNICGVGVKLVGEAKFKVVDATSQDTIHDASVFADERFYQPLLAFQMGFFSFDDPDQFELNYHEGYYSVAIFKNTPGIVYVMAGEEHIKNMEFSKIVKFYYPRDFDKDGVLVIKLTDEERK